MYLGQFYKVPVYIYLITLYCCTTLNNIIIFTQISILEIGRSYRNSVYKPNINTKSNNN